jgi:hypothetical protein
MNWTYLHKLIIDYEKGIFLNQYNNESKFKKIDIIKNASKLLYIKDQQKQLRTYYQFAKKYILCNEYIINKLHAKLLSPFEIIERILKENKYWLKNLDTRELIIKFVLQLKYIDTIYLSKTLLSEKFNEINIAQNIKNFAGFNNLKGVVMKFSPTTKNECENCWPSITEIVMNY